MPRARRIVGILIVLALIVAGGAVVLSSVSQGVFSLTCDELLASSDTMLNQSVRVTGRVATGSVRHAPDGALQFDLVGTGSERLACVFEGIVPDPFAEDRDVILEGSLQPDRRFVVRRITVKCPSKYQEEGVTEQQADEYYRNKYRRGHPDSLDTAAP